MTYRSGRHFLQIPGPTNVPDRVLRAIDSGQPVVYAPAMWRWVMLVIRSLPRAVMRKIGF